jgi:hypothetical protein
MWLNAKVYPPAQNTKQLTNLNTHLMETSTLRF